MDTNAQNADLKGRATGAGGTAFILETRVDYIASFAEE